MTGLSSKREDWSTSIPESATHSPDTEARWAHLHALHVSGKRMRVLQIRLKVSIGLKKRTLADIIRLM